MNQATHDRPKQDWEIEAERQRQWALQQIANEEDSAEPSLDVALPEQSESSPAVATQPPPKPQPPVRQQPTKEAGPQLTPHFVATATPGDLRRTLRRLGFRTVVDGRSFDPVGFIEGQHGVTPEQLLFASRRQLHLRIAYLPEPSQLRVEYFVEAQLSPQVVRNAVWNKNISGLTILPGFDRVEFSKATTYRSLDSLEVMSINMQRGRPNGANALTDHFVVRTHAMELDRKTGLVNVGGNYGMLNGQPSYTRTTLSRDLSREPGRSFMAIPSPRTDIIRNAIDVHAAMEMAAVAEDQGYQSLPILPKVYLGFKPDELPVRGENDLIYETPALHKAVMACVLKWMRQGLAIPPGPVGHVKWQWDTAPKLQSVDPDEIEDWATLHKLLGEVDVKYLLQWMLERSIVEHEGLQLLPLAFFPRDAFPAVVADLADVFVRVSDHLGRERFAFDGSTYIDRRYARLQTMQLYDGTGQVGAYRFDFTGTETGMEKVINSSEDGLNMAGGLDDPSNVENVP